ncbi:hypothetical protein ACNKHU_24555 [Shigella flexneri]
MDCWQGDDLPGFENPKVR